jgi:predicted RNA-binding protein with PUA-like domain
MDYWIFQAIPQRFDLRKGIVEGKQDTWDATRYLKLLKPDDIVFFWQAGSEDVRGVYGWGRVVSQPYIKPEWTKHGIDVIYEKRLRPHISVKEIKTIPALKDMLILRTAQNTNFLLSEDEARAISKLMKPEQRPEEI